MSDDGTKYGKWTPTPMLEEFLQELRESSDVERLRVLDLHHAEQEARLKQMIDTAGSMPMDHPAMVQMTSEYWMNVMVGKTARDRLREVTHE